MKLNLDILADYLPPYCRARRYGPQDRQLRFSMPLPYEAGRPMEPDTLYLAPASALQKKPPAGAAVICVGGQVPQSWLTGGTQLLHLAGVSDIYAAYHDILSVFNRFQQWDDALREELDNGTDFRFRHLLHIGSELLQKEIGISDQVLRGVFRSVITFDNAGSCRCTVEEPNSIIDAGHLEKIREASRLERQIRTPYLSMAPNLDMDYYCYNMYPQGHFLGCISIAAGSQPFRESDFALSDHLFAYLCKGYQQHIYTFGQRATPEAAALKKLLDHQPLTETEQHALTLRQNEMFFCLKLKEKRGSRSLLKEYMCTSIGASVPCDLYATIHHEEIVCLLRMNQSEYDEDHWLQETQIFLDYLDRMGYLCGISDSFRDYRELETHLQQASYAVEQGYREGGKTMNLFSDYLLQYILCECSVHIPADTIYSSTLRQLIERDRQRGSDYLHTLDVFLQSECNASKTAEQLYIHRSSLMKRLDKIQKVLNMDLEDPDVRLYLRICLRLLSLNQF